MKTAQTFEQKTFIILVGFLILLLPFMGGTTLSMMTLSIMTLSIMTLSIMTLSIMTLSIMTLNIMTLHTVDAQCRLYLVS